jgi:hypothetical protein
MKTYGGVDIQLYALLNSTLDAGEWSASRPAALLPGKEPIGTHWIWGWVGPSAGCGRGGEENKNPFIAPAGNWIPAMQSLS